MRKLVMKFNVSVEVEDAEITTESFEEYMASEESKETIEEIKQQIVKSITEEADGVTAKITNFKISFKE
jgi:hypothetical protein